MISNMLNPVRKTKVTERGEFTLNEVPKTQAIMNHGDLLSCTQIDKENKEIKKRLKWKGYRWLLGAKFPFQYLIQTHSPSVNI